MASPHYGTLSAARRYDLLLSLSGRIRSTLNLDEILEHVLDAVDAAVSYDAAGVFVLNHAAPQGFAGDARQFIAGIAQRGFPDRPPENDSMLMSGRGLVGHVIRTGEVVDVPDVRTDARYVAGRATTRSELAVPILGVGGVVGALNVESDRLQAFDGEDVEILHLFADAASAAIGRAVLHQELMERRRIEHQMQLAQTVQARLLPAEPPRVPGYDIAGMCLPTFEIGGDYYDFITVSDELLGMVVADVSGKGIAAALSMAAFRSVLRSQAKRRRDPSHLANRLNQLMPDSTGDSAYVTSVYALLEPADGTLRYTNCGHNPPLLVRADGTVERLDVGGFPLGIFLDSRYETGLVTLAPGDTVLLYTDGVVECEDGAHQEFGIERLASVLARERRSPAPRLLAEIFQATRDHCGADTFTDDFTLVILRRVPPVHDGGPRAT
jgi:sigma-B regulation protein RsbU (phosphoserine phosphatase)